MPTPTMCYLWYAQGKKRWAITPLEPVNGKLKHIYREKVILSQAMCTTVTINSGKDFGLPVDHALVCCVDLA